MARFLPSTMEAVKAVGKQKPTDERTSGTPWLILGGIGTFVVFWLRAPGPGGHHNY